MAEQDDYPTRRHDGAPVRRRPDFFALIVGLVALVASAYTLTDGNVWLPSIDLRWVLAGGALMIGLLLLAASLRPRR